MPVTARRDRPPAPAAAVAAAMLAAMAAAPAQAHAPPWTPGHIAIPWTFEPWVLACLAASAGAYAFGLARLWRKAGRGRGVGVGRAAAFYAGLLALVAALVSPLDALGGLLFSAHMVQHEMLMIVAAPLLVLGRPLAVWAWALPAAASGGIARACRGPVLGRIWDALTYAPAAWALHGIALWAWHVPALFQAALADDGIHTLQHASFFVTALLFWWAPLGAQSRAGQGASMLYLFTTMVHTGALGALLTLSPTLWYPAYGDSAAALGFDPLEDQQLGGLVMWVPAGIAYLATGLAVAARALNRGGAPGRARRTGGQFFGVPGAGAAEGACGAAAPCPSGAAGAGLAGAAGTDLSPSAAGAAGAGAPGTAGTDRSPDGTFSITPPVPGFDATGRPM
ncbi:hypothetical protein GCM10023144_18070 [Pigmentiphaga soli]|uniref:Cytochrome c oxidase assembly protein n=1 Tax=Pigmentiphaga soli TaxID=1007095 RepID=A0ABP8GVB1_9BURK